MGLESILQKSVFAVGLSTACTTQEDTPEMPAPYNTTPSTETDDFKLEVPNVYVQVDIDAIAVGTVEATNYDGALQCLYDDPQP